MKTLKITFLLLAILLLTVSGQSSDTLQNEEVNTYKQSETRYHLLVYNKDKGSIPSNQ
jgi:hypothetical protein